VHTSTELTDATKKLPGFSDNFTIDLADTVLNQPFLERVFFITKQMDRKKPTGPVQQGILLVRVQ
jgi:hypothetical protein